MGSPQVDECRCRPTQEVWRSYTPVGQDNHAAAAAAAAAADDDDDDENIDDDEGSCLSLRDAEFLLDLLGEEGVVPSPYY